jgi:hypothetical protein
MSSTHALPIAELLDAPATHGDLASTTLGSVITSLDSYDL